MQAHASARCERIDDADRLTTIRSAPPLTLRQGTAGLLYLVGSAAGPVGGDDLRLDLDVSSGASLAVRTVAASIVFPGATPSPSSFTLHADVGPDASLEWLPEPTVLVRGCDHRTETHIRLDEGSELVWREELVLGRWGETSGSLWQRLRVDRGGRPLVRHDLAVGPRWPLSQGPAGVGDALVVATILVAGPRAGSIPIAVPDGVRAASFEIADDVVLWSAVATQPRSLGAFASPIVAPVS